MATYDDQFGYTRFQSLFPPRAEDRWDGVNPHFTRLPHLY